MELELNDTLFAKQQVVRLHALLEASRLMHSTIVLDEVLHTVLQIVVRELEVKGAFFTNFPKFYGEVPKNFNSPIAKQAHDVADDPTKDLWLTFPLCDKSGEAFTDLVVIVPVDRTLTLDERDFLASLAMQAAVAIENARFHERALEWKRVETDLAAAQDMQRSLLPQHMPDIYGYSIAAHSVTCYEVGGDYLDIVQLPSGDTIFVVADVAGKGLSSALVSTSFRAALRAMAHSGINLLDLATRMNRLHHDEGPEARRRYVTTFLARLSPTTNTLEIVNAGHNTAFLLTGTGEVRRIESSGIPVGLFPWSGYASEQFVLDIGSRLLIYTDGLSETCRGEEMFGEDRLLQVFRGCSVLNAQGAIESLWAALNEFSDQPHQSDDMSALVLLRKA
jgi:serine phosphatase RsbU (regulator of sigma subunit)